MFYDLLTAVDWRTSGTSAPPFYSRNNISSNVVGLIDFPNAFFTDGAILNEQIANDQFPRNPSQPKVQEYMFQVERQLGANRSLTVSYQGSSGRDLTTVLDYNQTRTACGVMPAGSTLPGYPTFCAASAIRDPTFDWVKVRNTNGSSFFNSASVSFQQRFSNGLLYSASYTWAKSVDDGSDAQGGSDFGNGGSAPYRTIYSPAGPQDARGLSAFDIAQALKLYTVYNLPWGRGGQRAFSNRVLNTVLGGWAVSALGTAQSGPPFSVAGDISGAIEDRGGWPNLDSGPPNAAGTPITYNTRNPLAYYSTNSFVLPPLGQFGDVGRDSLIGPGLMDFDFSVQKEARIAPIGAEGLRLQLRLDMFNGFNRANFGLPSGTLFVQNGSCPGIVVNGVSTPNPACVNNVKYSANANAGTITTTTDPGRELQAAIRLIF
jgi:hypothetical protein